MRASNDNGRAWHQAATCRRAASIVGFNCPASRRKPDSLSIARATSGEQRFALSIWETWPLLFRPTFAPKSSSVRARSLRSAAMDVMGSVCMQLCSHITNEHSSFKVRTCHTDKRRRFPYNADMARRGVPKEPVQWFLREWMAARSMEGRGAQVRMMELTGWSKATMSQLFNGTQDYSPKILAEAATALNAEPFELLIHPERAMAIRQLRTTAAEIVKSEPAQRTGTDG